MKKISVVAVLAILSVATFSTAVLAARYCIVSSNPANNGGFCRADELGGDTCYMGGEGPGCSGTGGWEPPTIGG